MRLKDKVAIVVGAGQTPGETVGNGRATAILFAREGARLLLVDRDRDSLRETLGAVESEGGKAVMLQADVSMEESGRGIARACLEEYGRVDILHNNVGIGAGDAGVVHIELESWQRILDTNLTAMMLVTKHVLPVMREQESGSIINISSIASICNVPMIAYKVSKAGVNALTQQLAITNARFGIRVNAILPGLMNTPMAIEGISRARRISKEDLIAGRDAMVPLRKKMGTAWDVAHAAVFLASDEAGFVTGVLLAVDGGQSLRIG